MPRSVRHTVAFPARSLSRRLTAWFRRHKRDLPWRETRDPYRIWVSEIMLQQTTVKVVTPYFERFVERFPTVEHLARAPLDRVLAAWSGLGYYRRARHLHAAARLVARRHAGLLPDRREALLALPGIGRYTAGAILSIAYGRTEPVVDGNVARVLSRLLLIRGDPRTPPVATRHWRAARALVEASGAPGDLNQALMELGAVICRPVGPACPACPVAEMCGARAAGVQETVPRRRRAARAQRLRQTLALVQRDGRMLVRRRGKTGLMDGLWELPVVNAAGRAAGEDGLQVELGRRLARLSHTVTFRRFEVVVREARLLGEPRGAGYRWLGSAAARRLPASSLLTKVLDRLPREANADDRPWVRERVSWGAGTARRRPRGQDGKESQKMPRFLIEIPHEAETVACAKAVRVLLATGSHVLTHADFGCTDGVHKGWIIVEADSKEEARRILPPVYRTSADIVLLNKFGMREIDDLLRHHTGEA